MLYLVSDHAGFKLKEGIKKYLESDSCSYTDLGTNSEESVDWPSFGAKAAVRVSKDPLNTRAVIICGSGIGMSMVSNKFKGVRAALCKSEYEAEMSRKHNNSNVLNMGGRDLELSDAIKILKIWMNTDFEGGRHQKRLDILSKIEQENFK